MKAQSNRRTDLRSTARWGRQDRLPHLDQPWLIQHITYRLADSVPETALARMKQGIRGESKPSDAESVLRRRIEDYMDSGLGCCVLQTPEIAEMIIENWKHFDGQRYDLLSFVVMPNHCHVLIRTKMAERLPRIEHSWKSSSARQINRWRDQNGIPRDSARGGVWMRDYWDRFIRNEEHLKQVAEYIRYNPVKAGLVQTPSEWKWVMEYNDVSGPSSF